MLKQTLLCLLLLGLVMNGMAQRFRFEQTHIQESDFLVELPVETKYNLMFAEVIIKGKKFRFMVDTGAPMCMTVEAAKAIGLKATQTRKVGSSSTQSDTLKVGVLEEMELGGLHFQNITTFILDLNRTQVIRCLGIDGFIGSNVMKSSAWQFRVDEQKIVITDDVKRLEDVKDAKKQRMWLIGKQSAPYLSLKINKGKRAYGLLDSGYTGFFDWAYWHYQRTQRKKPKSLEGTILKEGWGMLSEGIYGSDDTSFFAIQSPKLEIAKGKLENVILEISYDDQNKVGGKWLHGRIVTLDFSHKRLYVKQVGELKDPHRLHTLGFGLRFDEGNAYVSSLWTGSAADEAGIELRDQIVEIDGVTYENIREEEICDMVLRFRAVRREKEEIKLKIRKANGQEKEIELKKANLFE